MKISSVRSRPTPSAPCSTTLSIPVLADVGEHFDRMAIAGHRRLVTLGPGGLQALLAQVALGQGPLQVIGRRRHADPATLAIEQQ